MLYIYIRIYGKGGGRETRAGDTVEILLCQTLQGLNTFSGESNLIIYV